MDIDLKLDWATHEAAKYACEKWHYSKCIPHSKIVKIGVWEQHKFIGVVLFSSGANNNLGKPYGLKQSESCELTRVALTKHLTPVTRIVSIALKILKKFSPGIKAVISFADTEHGHHGGIYQGGGWIYLGKTIPADEYIFNGKRWQGRGFRSSFGSHKKYIGKGLKIIKGSAKHRYLMPLNDKIKQQVLKLSKPYPKRVEHDVNVPPFHGGESGSIPTDALQTT